MQQIWTLRIVGAILISLGFLIRYIVARRKFNRRAMTGAEGFRTFERSWSISLAERIVRWVANILILGGIFVLFAFAIKF
jgi:hypothetical protein